MHKPSKIWAAKAILAITVCMGAYGLFFTGLGERQRSEQQLLLENADALESLDAKSSEHIRRQLSPDDLKSSHGLLLVDDSPASSGRRIMLCYSESGGNRRALSFHLTKTDYTGRFDVPSLVASNLILAFPESVEGQVAQCQVLANRDKALEAPLILNAQTTETKALRARVLPRSGGHGPGVSLVSDECGYLALTDEEGAFVLHVPALKTSYQLLAIPCDPAWSLAWRVVEGESRLEEGISLISTRAAQIEGVILSRGERRLVSNAHVALDLRRPPTLIDFLITSETEGGRFLLERLPNGLESILTCSAPGFATERISVRTFASEQAPQYVVHLRPLTRVVGRVVSAEEEPIAGAQVACEQVPSKVTDERGEFSLDQLDEERPYLYARAQGFGFGAVRASRSNSSEPYRATLILGSNHRVEGQVVDGHQIPLRDVTVRLHVPCEFAPSTTTLENGRFVLEELPAAPFDLQIVSQDGRSAIRRVVDTSQKLLVILESPLLLKGQVVDERRESPIPSFDLDLVACTPAGVPREQFEPQRMRAEESWCDADGRFALPVEPGETYELRVRSSGYAERVLTGIVASGAEAPALIVRMSSGAALRGHVIDARSNKPITNAHVAGVAWNRDSQRTLSIERVRGYQPATRTNENGAFSLDGVQLMPHRIVVLSNGYAPSITSFDPGSDNITIPMDPAGGIRVRFLNIEGEPLRGWRARGVDAAGIEHRAQGDAEGWIEWHGLAMGELVLSAYEPEQDRSTERTVFVAGGENREYVIGSAGIAQLEVLLVSNLLSFPSYPVRVEQNGLKTYGRTDAKGRVAFSDLHAGPARVICGALIESGFEIELVAGANSCTCDLRKRAIEGVVSSASSGGPVPGIQVQALRAGSSALFSGMSGENGQFEIVGLDSGTYTLMATDEVTHATARAVVKLSNEVPRSSVNLVLGGGHALTFECKDKNDGHAISSALVTLQTADGVPWHPLNKRSDKPSTYPGLPAGDYVLSIFADGYVALSQSVRVPCDTLVMELQPASSRLRVVVNGPMAALYDHLTLHYECENVAGATPGQYLKSGAEKILWHSSAGKGYAEAVLDHLPLGVFELHFRVLQRETLMSIEPNKSPLPLLEGTRSVYIDNKEDVVVTIDSR